MILFAVLFLTYYIVNFITGGNRKTLIEYQQHLVDTHGRDNNLTNEESSFRMNIMLRMTMLIVFGIAFIIAYIVFLANALAVQGAFFFTLIFWIVLVCTIIKAAKNSKTGKESTLEVKVAALTKLKKRNIKGRFIQLIHISYFIYMLVLLINQ